MDINKVITDKEGKPIHGFGINQSGEKVHVSTAASLGPQAFNGAEDFEKEAGMTIREWEERFNNFLPWSMSSTQELREYCDWLSDRLDKVEAESDRLRKALVRLWPPVLRPEVYNVYGTISAAIGAHQSATSGEIRAALNMSDEEILPLYMQIVKSDGHEGTEEEIRAAMKGKA